MIFLIFTPYYKVKHINNEKQGLEGVLEKALSDGLH